MAVPMLSGYTTDRQMTHDTWVYGWMLPSWWLLEIAFHTLFIIAWLADGDSLMCGIVMKGRQNSKMLCTFFQTKIRDLKSRNWPYPCFYGMKRHQFFVLFFFCFGKMENMSFWINDIMIPDTKNLWSTYHQKNGIWSVSQFQIMNLLWGSMFPWFKLSL